MNQPAAAQAIGNGMMPANLMTIPIQVPLDANASNEISADEIALYDRQIRLWGMKAQERIRSANVLLITMKALANEIAKNLVLPGIGSLTIMDHEPVTEADLGAQFFLTEDENVIGRNRAEAASAAIRKLNPRVKVNVDQGDIRTKGPSFFAAFDIVIATDLDPITLNVVNTATRLNQRPFYAAGSHGLYGFIFADLIEHDYTIQRDKGNVTTTPGTVESPTRSIVAIAEKVEGGKTIESVTKRELYSTWFLASDAASLPAEYTKSSRRLRAVSPALPCLRALWDFQQLHSRLPGHTREDLQQFTILAHQKHSQLGLPAGSLRSEFLRSFLQNIGAEVSPVVAILGGQLAQDVINVLGQTQQPIQNMVIFDGNTMEASMYPLHPDGRLGSAQLSVDPTAGMLPVGVPDMSAMPGMINMGAPMPGMMGDPAAMSMGLMQGMPVGDVNAMMAGMPPQGQTLGPGRGMDGMQAMNTAQNMIGPGGLGEMQGMNGSQMTGQAQAADQDGSAMQGVETQQGGEQEGQAQAAESEAQKLPEQALEQRQEQQSDATQDGNAQPSGGAPTEGGDASTGQPS